jgi:hypothetical protein
MALEPTPAYSGLRAGPIGQAYNEAAFRYFLGVDRVRAERMRRSILLVLASMRQTPGRCAPLSDATAAAIFAGLGAGVREVDFVGWYRQGRVAGAVLAQAAYLPDSQAGGVRERILAAISKEIHDARAASMRVRVVRLGFKVGD